MKILAISHIFPPAIDGGSKVIYQLSHYLEKQGHQLLYLSSDCSSTDDFTKSKYKKSKILKIHHFNSLKIPVYHHLRRPLKLANLFLPQKSYLYQLLAIFQKGPIFKFSPFVKTIIKIIKLNPDLIIAGPLPTTIVLYANFFKKITHSKLLINSSFHQSDPDFSRLPLIKTLQQADYLWTLTKYETNFFIKKLNIKPQKIILAGNGIDSKFIKKNNKTSLSKKKTGLSGKRVNILFIGSLAAHKRVDLLIKAFSSLSKSQDLQLTIVGQKTLFYPHLKKDYLSLSPNIRKKIHFKFNLKKTSQLIKIIDNSDFLILPSIQESFGLVLIEAWSRGKPVITSDIPSLKELVNQSNGGLIFSKDQQQDLQQQIKKLVSNPKLCHQLGKNGQDYVKNNYTWSKVSQKICQKISSSP